MFLEKISLIDTLKKLIFLYKNLPENHRTKDLLKHTRHISWTLQIIIITSSHFGHFKFFYLKLLPIFIHFLFYKHLRGISVGATTTSKSLHNIGKTTVVLDTSLGTACLLLFLLLFLNFWCLTLDLTGTSEGTVNLTTNKWNGNVQFNAAQRRYQIVRSEQASLTGQVEIFCVDIFKAGNSFLEKLKFRLMKNISFFLMILAKIELIRYFWDN